MKFIIEKMHKILQEVEHLLYIGSFAKFCSPYGPIWVQRPHLLTLIVGKTDASGSGGKGTSSKRNTNKLGNKYKCQSPHILSAHIISRKSKIRLCAVWLSLVNYIFNFPALAFERLPSIQPLAPSHHPTPSLGPSHQIPLPPPSEAFVPLRSGASFSFW